MVTSLGNDNLTKVIMDALMIGGGLPQNQIAQSLYILGQMVLMFFKGQGLVPQNISKIVMLPIFKGSIA
jgi:hypothetical protein